jgi:hypothetical protein
MREAGRLALEAQVLCSKHERWSTNNYNINLVISKTQELQEALTRMAHGGP